MVYWKAELRYKNYDIRRQERKIVGKKFRFKKILGLKKIATQKNLDHTKNLESKKFQE